MAEAELPHNFMCDAEKDGCYMYRDRVDNRLDLTTDLIDLEEQVVFSETIHGLLNVRKLEYLDEIKQMQSEFNHLEQAMTEERLEQE